MTQAEKLYNDVTNHCLVFYTMLLAVRNTDNVDITNLLSREVRQDYKAMNNAIDRFIRSFNHKFLTPSGKNLLDDQSYVFLDALALMRNKDTCDKTEILFSMMRDFIAGRATINTDDGEKHALPYAFEHEGRLYYPDQLVGMDLGQKTPVPLYK